MKTLKLIVAALLCILIIQSCSKKETSVTPSASIKIDGKNHIDSWSLGQPLTDGVYSFQNPNGNTFQGDSKTVGSLVQAYTNSTGWSPQEWQVTCLGDVYGVPVYSIINNYSGLALGVVGSSTTQNAQIDQETYTQAGNQIWGITIIAWGQYYIWNTHSGMALVIPGDVTTQGTDLVQQTYSSPNVSAQDWQPTLITQADSVTVNFGSTTGTMNHIASGFLHGMEYNGSTIIPPSTSTTPIDINEVRESTFDAPYPDLPSLISGIAAKGIKQEVNLSDVWNTGSWGSLTDTSTWAMWDTQIMQVVNWVNTGATGGIAGNPTTISFDLFNEPDLYFGSSYNTTFFQLWLRTYKEIRKAYPGAVIVGPSISSFNTTNLEQFLTYCKTNSCVPNYLSWHFSGSIGTDKNTISSYISTNSITGISGYEMNEYLSSSQEYAAETAWYIAQIDRAQLHAAMHANWANPTVTDNLSGVIGTPAQSYQTYATWWDYKAYADITGNTLTTAPGTNADVVAGVTTTGTKAVNMLVGAQSGLSKGTIKITCNNISSIFSGRTTLTVTVNNIPNSSGGFITGETSFFTENISVVSNSAYIYIPGTGNQDAYEVNIQ
jgi:hypothetical protein